MKRLDDFKLANEMLEKVLGGFTSTTPERLFTFQGENAVVQASNVGRQTSHVCGCMCNCSGAGAGAGGGGGAGH